MIVIGLTGSVGMGKTEVGKLFEKNKIKVFDSDYQVKLLYKTKDIIGAIQKTFPDSISKGTIDKKILTDIVFKDKKKLNTLEKILHNSLNKKQSFWVRSRIRQRDKIIVLDVPLLLEKDNIKKYDIIIVVSCSKEIQKVRVLKRKGWNKSRLEKTLDHQMIDKDKKQMGDFIIKTDRGKRIAMEEVIKIIKLSYLMNMRSSDQILYHFRNA